MPYCRNCGAMMEATDSFCRECGTAAATPAPKQEPYNDSTSYDYNSYRGYSEAAHYNEPAQYTQNDSGSIGWGILGFFFPLVGLILFLVWKDTKPRSARSAGIGALISVVLSIICYGLLFAFAGTMAAALY